MIVSKDNSALPLWNGVDGYIFDEVSRILTMGSSKNGTYTYTFLPRFATSTVEKMIGANGGLEHGLSIKLHLLWDESNVYVGEKGMTYTDAMLKDVYGASKAFTANISNYAGYAAKNLRLQVTLVSELGVEISGDVTIVQ
jgi:hypothetical protein